MMTRMAIWAAARPRRGVRPGGGGNDGLVGGGEGRIRLPIRVVLVVIFLVPFGPYVQRSFSSFFGRVQVV